MPRRNLIRQSEFPYHLTLRTNNKEWFKISMEKVWVIFIESIEYALGYCDVDIHAFVLMNNHYHLLVTTKNSDIDRFMMNLNRRLSLSIEKLSGVINHKFANRYGWTIVDRESYLYNVYRYIYQNPIRANLSKSILEYPFSSLNLNKSAYEKINLWTHFNNEEIWSWLSEEIDSNLSSEISKCLRKAYFRPSADIHVGEKYKLELSYLNQEKGA